MSCPSMFRGAEWSSGVPSSTVRRYDYAIFTGDRYSHNAMLTREEAERIEAGGLRCLDVEATMDPSLPRFRGSRYVTKRRPLPRRWG